jgi:hypothetical protein
MRAEFLLGSLKGIDHSKNKGGDYKVILNGSWVNTYGARSGLIWLGIWSSGGLL